MKKPAIVYGVCETGVQKKAVEKLSEILLDQTGEFPVCFPAHAAPDAEKYLCMYIGTGENNPYIRQEISALSHAEEYCIQVTENAVYIGGYDDAGVLYGCMDFYHEYLIEAECTHDSNTYFKNVFEQDKLKPFRRQSYPKVRDRGIWTWGHVVYDYRGFLDNMVRLKLNTLILWNDYVPVNAKELIAYAHDCNIKVIFGYSWLWDTNCGEMDLHTIYDSADGIVAQYEQEYAPLGADGIYFQSFTELNQEEIGGVLIAEAVTGFVNQIAARLFAKHPDLLLQFGLHATSVKEKLSYIQKVNPKIQIVWEDCGDFPFSYMPSDVDSREGTLELVEKITTLRGENEKFGAVTKGFTKLDWYAFRHPEGPMFIGTSTEEKAAERIRRKEKIWRYVQAYWLVHADRAQEAVQRMQELTGGEMCITALVEDGMFEKQILYPVALYAEMLWDCDMKLADKIPLIAQRGYVKFA